MEKQKGFSLVEIMIAAGFVVLVGVGLFFVMSKSETSSTEESTKQTEEVRDNTKLKENDLTETAKTPSINKNVINCGITGPIKFSGVLNYDRDLNENQKEAWSCLSDALETCSPAQLQIDDNVYTVLKKEKGSCLVSGPTYNETGDIKRIITCGFSDKLITASYLEAERNYPGSRYAKAPITLSVITFYDSFKITEIPLPDGSKEPFICK